jgi:hypothetical protein
MSLFLIYLSENGIISSHLFSLIVCLEFLFFLYFVFFFKEVGRFNVCSTWPPSHSAMTYIIGKNW